MTMRMMGAMTTMMKMNMRLRSMEKRLPFIFNTAINNYYKKGIKAVVPKRSIAHIFCLCSVKAKKKTSITRPFTK